MSNELLYKYTHKTQVHIAINEHKQNIAPTISLNLRTLYIGNLLLRFLFY